MSASGEARELFLGAASRVEDLFDVAKRRLKRRLGLGKPRHIVAYAGWGNDAGIWVRGRLLADTAEGGPGEEDAWWRNLVNTYRRWNSNEVPGEVVELRFREQVLRVTTDEEGYYAAFLPAADLVGSNMNSWRVHAACEVPGRPPVVSEHDVLVPGRDAARLIVSDVDDTVLHTGVTNVLLAAKLTFLGNAKTRKPLPGVAALYRALSAGATGAAVNPVFYVTSSAWNLYDLLVDFMELNDLPLGPLQMEDLGIDETRFLKEPGHRHKLEKVRRLLAAYPALPAVLIGDSGQHDPALYAEIARAHPGRVAAIYIRSVDAEGNLARDARVEEARRAAEAVGVPLVSAKDSVAFARDALVRGWLSEQDVEGVRAAVERDGERPTLGAAALTPE